MISSYISIYGSEVQRRRRNEKVKHVGEEERAAAMIKQHSV